MRKQKKCEDKRTKVNICQSNRNENFVEDFVELMREIFAN